MIFETESRQPAGRSEIATTISTLIGKALWKSNRAADLVAFHFGSRKQVKDLHSNNVEVGEYALHVQCPWRITREDRVLVGNGDLYYPADLRITEISQGFDWDKGPNRCDELLRMLFEGGTRDFVVQRIDVGEAGSLNIILDRGVELDVFPNDSLKDEYWRLFRPSSDERHFVITGDRRAGPA